MLWNLQCEPGYHDAYTLGLDSAIHAFKNTLSSLHP